MQGIHFKFFDVLRPLFDCIVTTLFQLDTVFALLKGTLQNHSKEKAQT